MLDFTHLKLGFIFEPLVVVELALETFEGVRLCVTGNLCGVLVPL